MFGEISTVTPIDELNAHGDAVSEPVPRASPAPGSSISDPPGGTPVPRGRPTRPALPMGILLYLASIGIVATATVGVLFGIGFSLLVKPTDALNAAVATRSRGSDVGSLLYSMVPHFFGDTAAAAYAKVVAVPSKSEILRPAAVTILPGAPATPQLSSADQISSPEQNAVEPASMVTNASGNNTKDASAADEANPAKVLGTADDAAAPVVAAGEPPPSATTRAVTVAPSGPAAVDVAELLARGDGYLGIGDVTSARLFYERAADAGSGQGAMRLGATFDPNFLDRAGLVGTRADRAEADIWYRRARGLGTAAATREPNSRTTK